MNLPRIAFFGTSEIAVYVLDELKREGILPSLVITNPDSPQGRKLHLTPTKVADWAASEHIFTIKPTSLKDEEVVRTLQECSCDLFLVAAYGKIIPETVLKIPKWKTLNMHPSLLPRLRGASPIRSAILNNENPTGVTIMQLNTKMDEGPILAQEKIQVQKDKWPIHGRILDETLARSGGQLLARTLREWLSGTITPIEQDHNQATYCAKITKEMGLLDFTLDPHLNLRKIRAFDGWPGTYFFYEKGDVKIRVKVLDAIVESEKLIITRIIPEGRREMDYDTFIHQVEA
jgi:methionyl-tRNA formyltransferase